MQSRSQKLVQLAMERLSCNHNELAEMLDLGDPINAELVAVTGSEEDLAKWTRLIEFLAALAAQSAETGYHTHPLDGSRRGERARAARPEFPDTKFRRVLTDSAAKNSQNHASPRVILPSLPRVSGSPLSGRLRAASFLARENRFS